MSDQELISQLRGTIRQIERETAATELYLKARLAMQASEIKQLQKSLDYNIDALSKADQKLWELGEDND